MSTSETLGTGEHVLGQFPTYAGAERLVDTLSDKGFPVEHLRIVGNGLRTVEHITGRLTTSRAALAGAASGAWFGLLIGLLLGLFVEGNGWLSLLLVGAALGAVWGGSLSFAAHWATRGRRDFTSTKGVEAEQYVVQVAREHADEAIRLSGRF